MPCFMFCPTEYIKGLRRNRGRVSALSAGVYTTTLHVMVDRVKGGGCALPTAPGWADFTIVMECTPETLPLRVYSVFCHVSSVYLVQHDYEILREEKVKINKYMLIIFLIFLSRLLNIHPISHPNTLEVDP